MRQTNMPFVVNKFKAKSNPDDRYTSFDYCFNYFLTEKDLTNDIEKSCLTLGFYLASWGMFRGSSFLLHKSLKHFQPTVKYIATLDDSVWDIDIDNYDETSMRIIIDIYNEIKNTLILHGNAHLTLITKILLGVFGFVPAFDNYFSNSFRNISGGYCGFRKLNTKSLIFLRSFYEANQSSIDKLSATTFTTNFLTGQKTKINYPKAKIIDMYGFSLGR